MILSFGDSIFSGRIKTSVADKKENYLLDII